MMGLLSYRRIVLWIAIGIWLWVIFSFVYYIRQSLQNEIYPNFANAAKSVKTFTDEIPTLDLACHQKPINEDIVFQINETMSKPYVNLMVAQDQLGKLISPSTYCSINQFLATSKQILMAKNSCPVMVTIPDTQVEELTQKLNADKNKVSLYKEYFAKERNQYYSPSICKKNTPAEGSKSPDSGQ